MPDEESGLVAERLEKRVQELEADNTRLRAKLSEAQEVAITLGSGMLRRAGMDAENDRLRKALAGLCAYRGLTAEGYTCTEVARVKRGVELCKACAALETGSV